MKMVCGEGTQRIVRCSHDILTMNNNNILRCEELAVVLVIVTLILIAVFK